MFKITGFALAAGFLAAALAVTAAPERADAKSSFSLHAPGFGLHIGPRHGYVHTPYFYGYKRKYHRKHYRPYRHCRKWSRRCSRRHGWGGRRFDRCMYRHGC